MVEKSVIKRLIAEYQEFVTGIRFVKRDIEVDYTRCNVFVGLRRAGKSYLMYQCIRQLIDNGMEPESVLFFNFEDDRVAEMKLSDLDNIKNCYEEMYPFKPVFFLDELQIVEGWEKFARRLADTGYQVFITGSNAKMLSSEIATTLGGRYALTEVFPFSFREFLAAKKTEIKSNWQYLPSNDIKRGFSEYFKMGGLPEVVEATPQFKRKWLSSLFDRIYFGDLVARNDIRKHESLKSLIRKLSESIGRPLTVNRAASIVSESGTPLRQETAASYLGYMEQAWLIFPMENYIGKLTEKISIKKYYYIDNGIVTLFKDSVDGLLLENLLAIALRKRYADGVYFYRHNFEVDFYIPNEATAIQASYSIADPDTRERECKALESLHTFRQLKRAVIITYDEEETILRPSGLEIQAIPLWKYLLSY